MPETPRTNDSANGAANPQANPLANGSPPAVPVKLASALDELHASLQLLSAALSEADRELTLAAEREASLYVTQYLRKL